MFPRGDPTVHKITLQQACQGLIHFKTAEGLNPHTIADYKPTFEKLLIFFDKDNSFENGRRKELAQFVERLQEDLISKSDSVAPRSKSPLATMTQRSHKSSRPLVLGNGR